MLFGMNLQKLDNTCASIQTAQNAIYLHKYFCRILRVVNILVQVYNRIIKGNQTNGGNQK